MLKTIDDPNLRSQITDKIGNTNTTSSNTRTIRERISAKNNSYTMAGVKR